MAQPAVQRDKTLIGEEELEGLGHCHAFIEGLVGMMRSWQNQDAHVTTGLLNADGEPITTQTFNEVLLAWDGFSRAFVRCLPAAERL